MKYAVVIIEISSIDFQPVPPRVVIAIGGGFLDVDSATLWAEEHVKSPQTYYVVQMEFAAQPLPVEGGEIEEPIPPEPIPPEDVLVTTESYPPETA